MNPLKTLMTYCPVCLLSVSFLWACATETSSDRSDDSAVESCVQACIDKGADEQLCRDYCEDEGKGKDDGDGKDDGKDDYESSSALAIQSITVNAEDRRYRLFVPDPVPAGPMPVLVAIHGGGGAEEAYPRENELTMLAQSEGFVAVFPMADLQAEDEGEWQLNTRSDDRRDIDFIDAILDHLGSNYAVDEARLYGTGYSLGSMFTYELVCQMSERFAAVASFAGTMPVMPDDCVPDVPMPIMHLHGTMDEIIPYDESWDWKRWDSVGTMRSIPSLMEFWSQRFSCERTTETEAADGASTLIVHDQCAEGVRVEHYRLNGWGHEWPNLVGEDTAHSTMWQFLASFTKP